MISNNDLAYHTSKVYELLSWFLCAYSGGAYLTNYFHEYIKFVTIVSTISIFVFMFLFICSSTQINKFLNSMLMSLSMGLSSGYFIRYVNHIDNTILPFTVSMTIVLFGTFTLVSNYVTNSQMLYLGGFLGGALNMLLMFGFMSMFFTMPDYANQYKLIFGLLTFCGFVTYDTHKMRQKIIGGNFDHYEHAMNLYLDFVNIFFKILSYVVNNKKSNKKKN